MPLKPPFSPRFWLGAAMMVWAIGTAGPIALNGAGVAQAQTVLGFDSAEITAVRDDDYNRLRELLLRGSNPNQANFDGFTLLIEATRLERLEIMRLLVDQRAGLEVGDKSGNTPLHWAAKEMAYDSIDLLLELGAEIDTQNRRGETPLMTAVRSEDRIMVETILSAGPDLGVRDYTGKTAADIARTSRDPRIADLLARAQ